MVISKYDQCEYYKQFFFYYLFISSSLSFSEPNVDSSIQTDEASGIQYKIEVYDKV